MSRRDTLIAKLRHFFEKKQEYFGPGIVLLVALLSCLPLFHPGYFSFHDFQHVARLYELDKALWAGQFPVRFVSGLGFGYGYALFNFYPPFLYYLGELFHLLGFSFVDSIKLVFGTALIGSALSMYFLARELWGKIAAIFCAILYLYIPYHAVDAYVRGALAELFSFVWLPLILLFSYLLIQKGKTVHLLGTALTLALLMITHNLIFLPFFGLFLLWCGAIMVVKGKVEARSIKNILLTVVLGWGLSAFFWLPALGEKHYTLVDQLLLKNLASYTIHFVCPEQLWNSLWGYGGSAAGCIDGISFKVGKIHLFLAFLSFLISAGLLIRRRTQVSLALLSLTALSLGILSLFMTIPSSSFVWSLLSPLWYLQFPWRFLEFAALFLCVGIGIIPTLIKHTFVRAVVVTGLSLLVLWQNSKLFEPQSYYPTWDDDVATSDEEIMGRVSSSSFEYLPKGMATHFDEKGDLKVSVDSLFASRSTVVFSNLKTQVLEQRNLPNFWQIKVTTLVPTTARFPIAVFPGWEATLDGKSIPIATDNDLHLLTVAVPAGTHTVTLSFENTPLRSLANLLTLVSTVVLVVTWYGSRRSKTKTH